MGFCPAQAGQTLFCGNWLKHLSVYVQYRTVQVIKAAHGTGLVYEDRCFLSVQCLDVTHLPHGSDNCILTKEVSAARSGSGRVLRQNNWPELRPPRWLRRGLLSSAQKTSVLLSIRPADPAWLAIWSGRPQLPLQSLRKCRWIYYWHSWARPQISLEKLV